MRRLALGCVVVAALLPLAAAVDEEELFLTVAYVRVTQVGDGLLAEHQVVVANPAAEPYGGPLTTYLPRGAFDVEWRFSSLGAGAAGPRTAFDLVRSEEAFDLVALRLGGGNDSIPADGMGHVTLSYRLAGDALRVKFAHPVNQTIVQAIPSSGQRPESADLGFTKLQDYWLANGGIARGYAPNDTFELRFVETPETAAGRSTALRDHWTWAAIGGASGAFLVGALVKGGILRIAPPRTRAQAGRPPLAEVARETLEARKRIVMAALKELDMAHRAGEIPASVHSPLKAEFMDEAVRVTRELDRRAAAGEAPAT